MRDDRERLRIMEAKTHEDTGPWQPRQLQAEDDDEEAEEGILQEPDSLQPTEEDEEEELNISPE